MPNGSDVICKLIHDERSGFIKEVVRRQRIRDLNIVSDTYHVTPLQCAVKLGDLKAVRILLKLGANVDYAPPPLRMTPLMYTALEQSVNIARLLLKSNANVNEKDVDGVTAYHRALVAESDKYRKLLEEAGADVSTAPNFRVRVFTDLDWLKRCEVSVFLAAGHSIDAKRTLREQLVRARAVSRKRAESGKVYIIDTRRKEVVEPIDDETAFKRLFELFSLNLESFRVAPGQRFQLKFMTDEERILPYVPFRADYDLDEPDQNGDDASQDASNSLSERTASTSQEYFSTEDSGSRRSAAANDDEYVETDSTRERHRIQRDYSDAMEMPDVLAMGSSFGAFWRYLRASKKEVARDVPLATSIRNDLVKLVAKMATDNELRATTIDEEAHNDPVQLAFKPLLESVATGNADLVRIVLEAGADVRAVGYAHTSYYRPQVFGVDEWDKLIRVDVDDELLERVRSGDLRHFEHVQSGLTALHVATMYGYTDICEILLDAGAEIDVVSGAKKELPIAFAIYNNHFDCVRLLIDRGAATYVEECNSNQPLDMAVMLGRFEIIRFLYRNARHVDLVRGGAVIGWAISLNRSEIAQFLFERGYTNMQLSPLNDWLIQRQGTGEMLDVLLEYGVLESVAGILLAVAGGMNPNKYSALLTILKSGVDVNAAGEYLSMSGITPLMAAARLNQAKCVRLLLAYGARVRSETSLQSAYDLSIRGAGDAPSRFHTLRLLAAHSDDVKRVRRLLLVVRFVQLLLDTVFLFALPFSATIAWPLSFDWLRDLADLFLLSWLPLVGLSPMIVSVAVIGVVLLLLVFVFVSIFRRCHDTDYLLSKHKKQIAVFDNRSELRRWGVSLLNTLSIVLAQLFFIPIFTALIRSFDCTWAPDGTLQWDQSPDVVCFDGVHAALVALSALVLVPYMYWVVRVVRTDGRYSGVSYVNVEKAGELRTKDVPIPLCSRIWNFKNDLRTLDAAEWHVLMRSPWLGPKVAYIELGVKVVSASVVVLLSTWPFLLAVVFLFVSLAFVSAWMWKPHTRLSVAFSCLEGTLRWMLLGNAAMSFVMAAYNNGVSFDKVVVDDSVLSLRGSIALHTYLGVLGSSVLLGAFISALWLRCRRNPMTESARELGLLDDEQTNLRRGRRPLQVDAPVQGHDAFTTYLNRVLEVGKPQAIEELRAMLPTVKDIDDRETYQAPPLHFAVKHGDVDAVAALLDAGANPNLKGIDHSTFLPYAAALGDLDMCKVLVEHGANINLCGVDGRSALSSACRAGHAELVRYLLENGIVVADHDAVHGQTALHEAVLHSDAELVRLLLEFGAPLEDYNYSRETPLFCALLDDDLTILNLLLDAGANIEHKSCADVAYIVEAARESASSLEKMEAEMKRCAVVTSPVYRAAQLGNVLATQRLIDAGASLKLPSDNEANRRWRPAFEYVETHGCSFAKAVVDLGPDKVSYAEGSIVLDYGRAPWAFRRSVMAINVECGNVNNVRALLDAGESGNGVEPTGLRRPWLILATWGDGWDGVEESTDVLELLLERGGEIADCAYRTRLGLHMTPLLTAALYGRHKACRVLLKRGASLDTQIALKDTIFERVVPPLVAAAFSGRVDTVRVLLEETRCDPNEHVRPLLESHCLRALHFAAANENLECVAALLDAGADVDAVDDCGCTPLLLACAQKSTNVARLLIEAGANVNQVTLNGENCLATARKLKQRKLTKLLLKHGAVMHLDENCAFLRMYRLIVDRLKSGAEKVSIFDEALWDDWYAKVGCYSNATTDTTFLSRLVRSYFEQDEAYNIVSLKEKFRDDTSKHVAKSYRIDSGRFDLHHERDDALAFSEVEREVICFFLDKEIDARDREWDEGSAGDTGAAYEEIVASLGDVATSNIDDFDAILRSFCTMHDDLLYLKGFVREDARRDRGLRIYPDYSMTESDYSYSYSRSYSYSYSDRDGGENSGDYYSYSWSKTSEKSGLAHTGTNSSDDRSDDEERGERVRGEKERKRVVNLDERDEKSEEESGSTEALGARSRAHRRRSGAHLYGSSRGAANLNNSMDARSGTRGLTNLKDSMGDNRPRGVGGGRDLRSSVTRVNLKASASRAPPKRSSVQLTMSRDEKILQRSLEAAVKAEKKRLLSGDVGELRNDTSDAQNETRMERVSKRHTLDLSRSRTSTPTSPTNLSMSMIELGVSDPSNPSTMSSVSNVSPRSPRSGGRRAARSPRSLRNRKRKVEKHVNNE